MPLLMDAADVLTLDAGNAWQSHPLEPWWEDAVVLHSIFPISTAVFLESVHAAMAGPLSIQHRADAVDAHQGFQVHLVASETSLVDAVRATTDLQGHIAGCVQDATLQNSSMQL